ncbi:hypothetical protein J5N97_004848 [Dioscorea zingiberensis]|uniref:PITH domain-containing protein n=1 Tax=Dioscorea zingiberensis TaxID=325984 RepID=A0A9D5HSK5_9LILI|nr:hypothetical protein J5N97_004848 [Dioscorea zingiberensis]
MVEAQCSVQLAFPVVLKNTAMMEEIHFIGFLNKLLETKIMQVLRFKHGQIYSVGVSVFLGGNKPSRTGDVRGDISVNFSCDPDISWKLVDLALEEIYYLQDQGPSDEDVSTILEIEQRAHENGLQENYYWMDRILRSYQSRAYFGDVSASFEIQDEGRAKVRNSLTPSTMQSALQRVLPFPCIKQYTVVILMPQVSRLKLLIPWTLFKSSGISRDAKILAAAAGAVVLSVSLWREFWKSNDGDPELIVFFIPFINRDGIDFSDAQNMQPIQEWDLVENLQGVLEYQTRYRLGFKVWVVSLCIFLQTFGGDTTQIYYIGFARRSYSAIVKALDKTVKIATDYND